MKYNLIDPKLPSFSRWRSLNKKYPRQSTLRMMQYEALEELDLSGKLLDIGGGDRAKYRNILPQTIEYSSVNIDPKIEPTWIVEPGGPLPIEDDSFDVCLSLNTLEHVYDAQFLIKEAFQALKSGGMMHISVPWMFRIHGHPYDYTRHTPQWWCETMENTGFSETSVTPLIWGRNSTAVSMGGHRLFKSLSAHIAHINDIVYSKIGFYNSGGRYSGEGGGRICSVAVGHFISAKK